MFGSFLDIWEMPCGRLFGPVFTFYLLLYLLTIMSHRHYCYITRENYTINDDVFINSK